MVYPGRRKNSKFESIFSPYVKKCYHAHIQTSIRAGLLYRKRGIKKAVNKALCFSESITQHREHSELKKIVDEVKPDIIHSNSGVIHGGYEISRECNIPHVWHLREYQDKDFLLKFIPSKEHFIKELHSSYVIAITKGILQHFQLQDSNTAKYIYNGCLSVKDKRLFLPKEKYFLCSTRVVPEKGHIEIIKAFSQFYKKS